MAAPLPTLLLLAAGQSRRFGAPKLLADLAGRPVLAHTLAAARAAGLPWKLVLRPGDTELARWVDRPEQCIVATDAALGLGHSIAAGVTATAASPGWLILPADMPWVSPALLQAVAAAMAAQPDAIIAPVWQGQRGHPVGFPARLLTALQALHGDEGGRQLLRRFGFQAIAGEPGCLRDVDVPEDLSPP